jgi:hypothetical protein
MHLEYPLAACSAVVGYFLIPNNARKDSFRENVGRIDWFGQAANGEINQKKPRHVERMMNAAPRNGPMILPIPPNNARKDSFRENVGRIDWFGLLASSIGIIFLLIPTLSLWVYWNLPGSIGSVATFHSISKNATSEQPPITSSSKIRSSLQSSCRAFCMVQFTRQAFTTCHCTTW